MKNGTNGTPKKRDQTLKPWQAQFLLALGSTGNVSAACQVVRKGNRPLSRTTVYRNRDSNPAFREAWEETLAATADELEVAMKSRAIKGHVEPVFWKGKVVGSIRKWDTLLQIFMLKKLNPETFGDHSHEHGGVTPNEYAAQCRRALAEMEAVGSVPVSEYIEHVEAVVPEGEM